MSIVTIQKCPICSSIKIKPEFVCKDYLTSNENFDVYMCQQCEFLFTNNFPSNNSIGKYYDNPKYISHSDTKQGFINKLYHFVRAYVIKRKLNFVCRQAGKKNGKILDIGCGTGYFLNEAKRKGWETAGIEKNEQARKSATEHFNLFVKHETHIYEFPKDSFDVITLWHVLEHLEDLSEIMEKIYDLLLSDGIAVIALPNCSSYDARHYKTYWAGYDLPRHLWHFTPKTMELLAKKFNFNIVYKKPMHFDSFYVSILSEKYKRHTYVIAFIKAMFIGAVSNIKALRNKDKGSSIVYVLKKNSSMNLEQKH
ncbi:MAG: class I SAM-dependent methyltransferase [Prevotellaceae bacterium]|jgi:2-polyprenyl-3-methyl-5-hydroxy-6-metoxy-1,4-benzoquinol methylase|nr:class I SAM-dependent methyltransferase [Prevotellaceae bacterium]